MLKKTLNTVLIFVNNFKNGRLASNLRDCMPSVKQMAATDMVSSDQVSKRRVEEEANNCSDSKRAKLDQVLFYS